MTDGRSKPQKHNHHSFQQQPRSQRKTRYKVICSNFPCSLFLCFLAVGGFFGFLGFFVIAFLSLSVFQAAGMEGGYPVDFFFQANHDA